MMERPYEGWALRLITKDWTSFMGILYGDYQPASRFPYDFIDTMAIRTRVFRTRQQARDFKKKVFYDQNYIRAIVVKVKVTINEI
jgi:hypothetical protein